MDRKELNVYLAAILTTLVELDTDCSESTVYLALNMDFYKYQVVRNVLVTANLVYVANYRIRLTDAGKAMAEKCNEFAKTR